MIIGNNYDNHENQYINSDNNRNNDKSDGNDDNDKLTITVTIKRSRSLTRGKGHLLRKRVKAKEI